MFYFFLIFYIFSASFPNAFGAQTTTQQLQAAANSPAGKQTEGSIVLVVHSNIYICNNLSKVVCFL